MHRNTALPSDRASHKEKFQQLLRELSCGAEERSIKNPGVFAGVYSPGVRKEEISQRHGALKER